MRRRLLALAPLLLLALLPAVAGCADIDPPPAGSQAAGFGVLITWDTTMATNTVAAEDALVAKCGLPVSSRPGPGGVVGHGESSSYVAVPSGRLPDTQASCLTASKLVTQVAVLSSPVPRSS